MARASRVCIRGSQHDVSRIIGDAMATMKTFGMQKHGARALCLCSCFLILGSDGTRWFAWFVSVSSGRVCAMEPLQFHPATSSAKRAQHSPNNGDWSILTALIHCSTPK